MREELGHAIGGRRLASCLQNQVARARRHTLGLVADVPERLLNRQPMPDASPVKWHLAHTNWFWETFVLGAQPGYTAFDPAFAQQFNSYYNALGPLYPRGKRADMVRPSLAEVLAYRAHVDGALACADLDALADVVRLGIAHEEQHAELIATDLLYSAWVDGAARPGLPALPIQGAGPDGWHELEGGLVWMGDRGADFAFDNERPRHRVWLEPFEIARGFVSETDLAECIENGLYQEPSLWLSLGWDWVQAEGVTHPLYWRGGPGGWETYGAEGWRSISEQCAASQLNFFEADAAATMLGARLPTEAEWEHAASEACITAENSPVWQWTRSAYAPYPRFSAGSGPLSEYNGKFMCNQYVLRGASIATPPGHSRATYRNFFPPEARWQFSGVRLARDAPKL